MTICGHYKSNKGTEVGKIGNWLSAGNEVNKTAIIIIIIIIIICSRRYYTNL